MSPGLALDLVVAVLLVLTIAYAWRLNRRLESVRTARADLESLIAGFGDAIDRAQAGVAELKAASSHGLGRLRTAMTAAEGLRDDLAFLTDRAEGIADRLAEATPSPRPRPGGGIGLVSAKSEPAPAAKAPAAATDTEIARSLKGVR